MKGGIELPRSRAYNNAYNAKKSLEKLSAVIALNFQNAVLISFQFKPGAPVSFSFVQKYLSSWDHASRKLLGGNYEFVRIADYANAQTGEMVFHYIADLTQEQCEKVVAGWYMGKTNIKHLSQQDLEDLPRVLALRPDTLKEYAKYKRLWSCTRGIRRSA